MGLVNFKGSLLATTVIAGMVLAAPAYAQANPAEGAAPASDENPEAGVQTNETAAPAEPTSAEEIVVTGTLIRNPNLVASAPVNVIGQEEMQLRQTNVAEEVLRTIPGAASSIGSNVNNGNAGASFVNLRGIGVNRNLVLLDGVRLVPTNLAGTTDLNNIPLALVDRVDSLTGGASTTYGADAVSGVVNFITRSDFAGMELGVSNQITERGDGHYLRGDLTIGANFDDGRGNAVIGIGYQESDPVYQGGDRPLSQFAFNSQSPNPALLGSPTATPSTIFGLCPAVAPNEGVCVPVGTAGATTNVQVTDDGTSFAAADRPFNFAPYNAFQTPFKRYNLYSAGHYDVSEAITVYARGLYSNNTVDTIIAPSGAFNIAVAVPLSNPFLSADQRAILCTRADFGAAAGIQTLESLGITCAAATAALTPTDPNFAVARVNLSRRATELGPRVSSYNTQVFDFRVGARGDITNEIGWDVWASRGFSKRTQTIQGYALNSRIRAAVFASNPDTCLAPNANFNVTTGTGTSSQAGCVPVNFFGGPGTLTPEGFDYISDESQTANNNKRTQARATINGDTPVQLWSDQPISFAVGGEYRKDYANTRADALARAGDLGGSGGASPDITGQFDVYEGFAEVIAPLVSDRPFIQELQLEAGIRRSHYTIDIAGAPKFNTTTWKVAGSWAPVRDLKIRGNFNRAVRAPNINELFSPVNTVLTNLATDPCQGAAPLTNPALAAVCIAQGADPSFIGSIPPPAAGQVNITGGGNPFLRPETAKTWTLGAVVRPSFLPGFDATIDYYNIRVNEAVTTPTTGDLLDACFDTLDPSSPACTVIQRNPATGSLSGDPTTTPGLFGVLSNLGKIETDGVDLVANYRRSLGTLIGSPARINLSFAGNWTRSSKFQATPTSINRECVGYYSANCGFGGGSPNPEFTFSQRSTLSLGKVDISLLWRYIHKLQYEPLQLETEIADAIAANTDAAGNPLPVAQQGCPDFDGFDAAACVTDAQYTRIPTYHYFDLSTRYNVSENFDFTFSIQNLFDKDPPDVGNSVGTTAFNSGNTYPATYDSLGRRFGAAARIKF
ncbi:TonB-dependent receptor [Sphingomonas lutea]|uniref:TonB-dependent receptor n=1 Tax=Sphingomonas lutea TaxID=1045317 RepID=A0A7G9SH42_9SPHN|nr:TonB-dependent receptor [Sphingomonas lutea]QNN67167.1 TonB-dependent receptor [Sphingomonas lutea]